MHAIHSSTGPIPFAVYYCRFQYEDVTNDLKVSHEPFPYVIHGFLLPQGVMHCRSVVVKNTITRTTPSKDRVETAGGFPVSICSVQALPLRLLRYIPSFGVGLPVSWLDNQYRLCNCVRAIGVSSVSMFFRHHLLSGQADIQAPNTTCCNHGSSNFHDFHFKPTALRPRAKTSVP